jgi:hypothetical protein
MHSDHSLGSFILKHLSIVHQAGVMLIRGSPPAIAVDLTPRSLAPRPIRGLRTGVKLRRILFVRCKQRVADASCVRAAAAKRLRLRCRDNPLQTLPQQADVMCRVLQRGGGARRLPRSASLATGAIAHTNASYCPLHFRFARGQFSCDPASARVGA